MIEVIIPITSVNPVELFGVNDAHLEILRKYFPNLKMVARGNELKVMGNSDEIETLRRKLKELADELKSKKSLDDYQFEEILKTTGGAIASSADQAAGDIIVYGPNGLMVKARTVNQKKMVTASTQNDIVFAIGPAGTGKTYTAVALAVRALKNREIKRIILTRPAVEAGENLGFLPGDLKEKIDPYLRPLYDALFDMLPAEKVKTYIESGIIEVAPLAFMRGRTLDNAYVLLDEAQNATESQLKMFLTRMGPSAKFIVTGDVTQIDLPLRQPSGLLQAMKVLPSISGIEFIYLDQQDVVRHKLVKEIILAYHNESQGTRM